VKGVRTALLGACILVLSGCKEQILHDLDESTANRVQLALSRAAVKAEKRRVGKHWSIAVEAEQVNAALATVERSRILRTDLERAAEQGGLLQSAEDRVRADERQTAVRTERTLERVPGVLEARVHLHHSGSLRFLPDSRPAGSASVLLVSEKGSRLDVAEIRSFVAGAAGLKPEQISVLMIAGAPENDSDPPIVPAERPAARVASQVFLFAGVSAVVLCLSLFRARCGRPLTRWVRHAAVPRTEAAAPFATATAYHPFVPKPSAVLGREAP
jgi:type III secretory pathway lipoprotein EscJ